MRCACVSRGIKIPLLLLLISNCAVASGVVVPMPTDCELAGKKNMAVKKKANYKFFHKKFCRKLSTIFLKIILQTGNGCIWLQTAFLKS